MTAEHWDFALGQNDRAALCRDRPQTTPEIHAPNDYYGQATILKRYAGLPPDKPFTFVLEHGLRFDRGMGPIDRDALLESVGSPSARRAEILRTLTTKAVVPIGFGYLYAQDLVAREHGPDPAPHERRGTLVFPAHSTHYIRARFDHDAYADQLVGLPADFQPVAICGYWKDILDGSLEAYARRGMPLVTCGHMFDHDFLLRLHDLCRRFRYATGNRIGTSLFAAAASGCRFFYSGPEEVAYDVPQQLRNTTGRRDDEYEAVSARSRELFDRPRSHDAAAQIAAQMAFVAEHLGTASKLSPEGLRAFAGECDARHRRHTVGRFGRKMLAKLRRKGFFRGRAA